MESIKSIRIKNENCTSAGSECMCLTDDRRGSEEPCGDCYEQEVSQEAADSLRKQAKAAGAGTDLYLLKCARTVEEYL